MNIFTSIVLWVTYLISLYFSIFFLLIFLDKKSLFAQEGKSRPKLTTFPMVSVLIPAYNEEKTIIPTIKSVLNLDYLRNKLEVIVIDDGSTDKTKEIVENFIRGKKQIRLISHQNMGKAASLNHALKTAKGEFFACLDADSEVHPKTLRRMLALYYQQQDPKLAIITPAMKVKSPKKIIQKIQHIEYLISIFIARLSGQIDSIYVAPGPFSLYKKEIIQKAGGFDESSLTEDQEISYRIQAMNYKIKQCFNGFVYTETPATFKDFYKQRRRWYLGSLSCLAKYRRMILNKKYGDFGMIQIMKNIAGFALAITGLGFAFYFLVWPVVEKFSHLALINFEFWPYLRNLSFDFSILSLDFKKGFIVMALFSITLTVFYLAHRNIKEKIMKFGLLPIIPYLAVYYLLKSIIFILSILNHLSGKRIKW